MAKTWIVSRHPGAVSLLEAQGWSGILIDHLDVERIERGDTVIGTLPINLAAEVCAKGASYLHLSLRVPFSLRGKELSPEQMLECGATVEAFDVLRPAGAKRHTLGDTSPVSNER